jgi:hypothetical protein
LRPGICCTVAASGGLCEGEKFQEIVGGADHGPLGTYFLDAAQQKLAEAAGSCESSIAFGEKTRAKNQNTRVF